MQSVNALNDPTTFEYDDANQLLQVTFPDSTTATYKYDGLGRRIEKNVDGSITRYVYDGEGIVLEFNGTNTFLARYSHGDRIDQPLVLQKAGSGTVDVGASSPLRVPYACRDYEPFRSARSQVPEGFFYYHSNHQGSITHLSDTSGNVANQYVYAIADSKLCACSCARTSQGLGIRSNGTLSGFAIVMAESSLLLSRCLNRLLIPDERGIQKVVCTTTGHDTTTPRYAGF